MFQLPRACTRIASAATRWQRRPLVRKFHGVSIQLADRGVTRRAPRSMPMRNIAEAEEDDIPEVRDEEALEAISNDEAWFRRGLRYQLAKQRLDPKSLEDAFEFPSPEEMGYENIFSQSKPMVLSSQATNFLAEAFDKAEYPEDYDDALYKLTSSESMSEEAALEIRQHMRTAFEKQDQFLQQAVTDEEVQALLDGSSKDAFHMQKAATRFIPDYRSLPRAEDLGNQSADVEEEEEEDDQSNYNMLMKSYGGDFGSHDELRNYAKLLDVVDAYMQHKQQVNELLETEQDAELRATLEQSHEEYDELIKEALITVVDIERREVPYHKPGESSASASILNAIGDVPVGPNGMLNLTEEHLRLVANRPDFESQHRHTLAKRLIAGELVKFRSQFELKEAVQAATDMARTPGQSLAGNVSFETPDTDAQRHISAQLASGRYHDPRDAELEGDLVKSMARLVAGNASYAGRGKEMMLETVRGLLGTRPKRAA